MLIPSPTGLIERPLIDIHNGIIRRNHTPLRVVLEKDLIQIGYIDITPQAAYYIMQEWTKRFEKPLYPVVLQP